MDEVNPIRKDEAFLKELHDMIQRYVDGAAWSALAVDLLRTGDLTMEPVCCVLMSKNDYDTISLMLNVLQKDKKQSERIFQAIVDGMKKVEEEDDKDRIN